MTQIFDDTVRSAVLGHMNGDHGDDNLLIVRAFGDAGDLVSATMTDFDQDGGEWRAFAVSGTAATVRVPWPGGRISQRAEVRREIVALYDAACRRLGLEPRPHA